MPWTEGTCIISNDISITRDYCGILTVMIGLNIIIGFIVSVALLMAWYIDTYF